MTTPASLICWGTTLGGPHWNTGDATWDSPLCIRYVTSRSPYHLPNFSHPTALHAPTTSLNIKLFGPILKYIETLFIHVQSLIGIASQPKPLTVRRPTVSDSGSRSSPHSVQRSLHRRDIPHWKFADYSPDPDPGYSFALATPRGACLAAMFCWSWRGTVCYARGRLPDISDFKCHRADRNEHGGGLMCYIRNDLAHRRRADLECLVTAPVESLIVVVIVRQEKWLFIGMYNPSYRYKNECCTNIEIVFDTCRNEKMASVFFVGDLNIYIMKPCVSACLSDTLDICGLTYMIRKPTCFKSPAGTLLDVILTASPKRVASVLNVDTAISDFHNLIAFSTKLHVQRTTRDPIWYRSYKKFDEEYFKRDIATAPYHVGEIFDDLDDKFWYSKSLIDDIINEHAPLINASLRKACHKKSMARNKYFIQGRTQILWEKYRKSRNHASKVKKDIYEKLLWIKV